MKKFRQLICVLFGHSYFTIRTEYEDQNFKRTWNTKHVTLECSRCECRTIRTSDIYGVTCGG
jgi:hypothetical protein